MLNLQLLVTNRRREFVVVRLQRVELLDHFLSASRDASDLLLDRHQRGAILAGALSFTYLAVQRRETLIQLSIFVV